MEPQFNETVIERSELTDEYHSFQPVGLAIGDNVGHGLDYIAAV
jgi:hypothetical protein